jgi:hypothetical protein
MPEACSDETKKFGIHFDPLLKGTNGCRYTKDVLK